MNYCKNLGTFLRMYDAEILPETVKEFEISLDEVGIENDITIYPGVNHAFAIHLATDMRLMNQRMHGTRLLPSLSKI
ncbi:MAG: hypothetical protein ACR2LL_09230 [Nitrosopumilus sp.]|uniref:hypothetical protein n=1 Tax=Nitrosopumilus sp. TaxID=2024843 RepID=UPI0029306CF0|nr:hypothetical protein [Nitrosopumilus sp.]